MQLVPSEIQFGKIKIPIDAFIFFDVSEEGEAEETEEEEEIAFAMRGEKL